MFVIFLTFVINYTLREKKLIVRTEFDNKIVVWLIQKFVLKNFYSLRE